MRKFLFCVLLLSLNCCNSKTIEFSENQYEEIEYPDAFIEWRNLLIQEEEKYFVYVFSYDCFYCKETKRKVIDFYNVSPFPVYFCEYSKKIPIGHNITNTIGMNNIDDIYIKGTPTLLLISNSTIYFNVAGKEEVNDLIDLYIKNQY